MQDGKTEQWQAAAHKIIEQVAKGNQYVVSDMVVNALENAGLGLDNYSPLGGVFKRAAKDGIIAKTDEKQQSTRGKSHSAKTVWVSLIYKREDVSPEAAALSNLIMAALDFNAETVRYASVLYRNGGLDVKTHEKAVKAFNEIQDHYNARIAKIVEDFEKAGGRRAGQEGNNAS